LKAEIPSKRLLAVTGMAMASSLTAYECVKQALLPGITIWQSHAMTIVFGTAAAVVIAHFVLRRSDALARAMQERAAESARAEAALRESEERRRHLFAESPLGMYRSTPEGRLLIANPALMKLLGCSSMKEASGLDLEATTAEAGYDRSAFREAIERDGVVLGMETVWKRRDGRSLTFRENARAVRDSEGRIVAYEGTVEDMTDRRRLEDQLRQSQKMEAVGQLAAGVAHDFNNLLTAILGFGEVVMEDLGPGHPHARSLEQVVRAGERAAGLTKQLLAFSRRDAAHVVVLDPGAVVADVVPMLRRLVSEDIELTALAPRGACAVRADRGQLEQVVMNLVVNARDAMPTGGKLTIEVQAVVLDEHYAADHPEFKPGRYVRLSVADTGVGMDKHTRDHLFEPYFTTKELGRGTGLGLATVYGIVRQSEGYVAVYSEPDFGTTFKIYLPACDAAAVPPPDAGGTDVPGGSETVLLVEDEPGVRELGECTLAELGYVVIVATNGAHAVELAAATTQRIDLLVTDVVMPGMNGREVAARLAATRPGVKQLFMSGYTDDAIVRHGILQSQVPFLQKPFTPSDLARKVRLVLDGAAVGAASAAPAPSLAG
jgi:two-component system cell cycle sensor histidine kinase/response regulator CckA